MTLNDFYSDVRTIQRNGFAEPEKAEPPIGTPGEILDDVAYGFEKDRLPRGNRKAPFLIRCYAEACFCITAMNDFAFSEWMMNPFDHIHRSDEWMRHRAATPGEKAARSRRCNAGGHFSHHWRACELAWAQAGWKGRLAFFKRTEEADGDAAGEAVLVEAQRLGELASSIAGSMKIDVVEFCPPAFKWERGDLEGRWHEGRKWND